MFVRYNFYKEKCCNDKGTKEENKKHETLLKIQHIFNNGEKIIFQQMVVELLETHMQTHECIHRSYTLHKNQLKIDNSPKIYNTKYKTPRK